MRRFFFIVVSLWLSLNAAAYAATSASSPILTVVQPSGPLDPGSACAGPHPIVVVTVKNIGRVANVFVPSPDGATIAGGPISGYASLPAIQPGGSDTVRFEVTSTRGSMTPPKRSERLITMTVHLDPKHRAGLAENSADVPALLTTATCTGPDPDTSPSPSPTPTPSPKPTPSPTPKPTPSPTPTATPTPSPTPTAASGGSGSRFLGRGVIPPQTLARFATPSPTPSPAPIAGSRFSQRTVIQNPDVLAVAPPPPAPQHVREPTGMQDCRDHAGFAGGLVCAAVFGPGGSGLALVWDTYPAKVDGFRVYTIRGQRAPISPQINANGNGVTFGYVGGNSNSFSGQCFVVTAYAGDKESADSAPFCANGSVGGTATTLAPDHIASYEASQGGNTGVLGSVLDGLLDPAGIFRSLLHPNSHGFVDGNAVVGYEHRTSKSDAGDSYYNMLARGAAHFDTTALKGHYIGSAVLTLAVDFAYTGRGNTPQKTQDSCTVTVEPATQLWWDETGTLFNVDPSSAVTGGSGQTVSFDVTRTVRNWANGAANDGFVFVGGDENLKAFFESSCLSHYQSVSLAVNYF